MYMYVYACVLEQYVCLSVFSLNMSFKYVEVMGHIEVNWHPCVGGGGAYMYLLYSICW